MQLPSGRPVAVNFKGNDIHVTYGYSEVDDMEDVLHDQIVCGGKIENWNGEYRRLTIRYNSREHYIRD